jgi:hypothetical protein
VAEWSKAAVLKNEKASSDFTKYAEKQPVRETESHEIERDKGAAGQSMANPDVFERAIAAITRRLATAADDEISSLVDERRALREELRAARESAAGNVLRFRGRKKGGA